MNRRQAIGIVLQEDLPAMRSAEFAAALLADGQAELFPDMRRVPAQAPRYAPLFDAYPESRETRDCTARRQSDET